MSAQAKVPESYLRDRPALTRRTRRMIHLLVPVALAGVCGMLGATDLFVAQERLSIDARFRRRGPLPPDPRIVIVEIGTAARRELREGDRQFNLRARLAEVIDRLADAGSLVVGVDVWLDGRGDEATDERLADVISNASTVLAVVHVGGAVVRPAEVFLAAEPDEGLINVTPDPDGVLRRLPAHPNLSTLHPETAEPQIIPFLPFVLSFIALDEEAFASGADPLPTELDDAGHTVLVGRHVDHDTLVNFAAGPEQGFTTLSFADVALGRADLAPVDGAVVLIGESRAVADQFTMPLSMDRVPGVYFHANVVDQILQNRPLTEWPAPGAPMGWLVGVLALLSGWYFWNLREWWRRASERWLLALYLALGVALFGIGWWVACQWAFERRVVLPMVAPLAVMGGVGLTGLVGQLGVTLVGARRLAQRNRQIESLFGRSVSPQVLQAIKSDPQRIARTEVRDVSVLFCDIRGFTATSGDMRPEAVAAMLNEYFEAITSAVFEHDGFVDKFVGDELMAVFGVPLDQPDHAERAAQTALAIKKHLADLNDKRAARGEQPLACGVGIHCGPAASGHIGTAARANYTVVGETVNLASRIEGLTDQGEILVSADLAGRLPAELACRPWKTVALRGSDRPHELFEIPQ